MKLRILTAGLRWLLSTLEPQFVRELVDDMLDKVEDRYAENALVMQAVALVRSSFNIPDDVGGDED